MTPIPKKWPYSKPLGQLGVSRRIILDSVRWDKEFSDKANLRTLERLTAEEGAALLAHDVKQLDKIEAAFPSDKVAAANTGDAPKIPCPICKSVAYLVPSMLHPKVLVCDRPNCIYDRTRDKIHKQSLKLVV